MVGGEALKPLFKGMILSLHEYHDFIQNHFPSFLPIQNLSANEGSTIEIFIISMTPILKILPISILPIPFLWYWAKSYQHSTGHLSEFKRPMRFIPITSIILIELFLWLPLVFFLAYCIAEVLIIFVLILAFSLSYFLLPGFYMTMLFLRPVTKDLFVEAGLHHIHLGSAIDNVENTVEELADVRSALVSTYDVIVTDIPEDDLAWHCFGEDNPESIEQYVVNALDNVRLLAQMRDSEVDNRHFDQEMDQAIEVIHDIIGLVQNSVSRMDSVLNSSEMFMSKGRTEANLNAIKGLFREELGQFMKEAKSEEEVEEVEDEEVGYGTRLFRFLFGSPSRPEEAVARDENILD